MGNILYDVRSTMRTWNDQWPDVVDMGERDAEMPSHVICPVSERHGGVTIKHPLVSR
jgi:hypothetical protein